MLGLILFTNYWGETWLIMDNLKKYIDPLISIGLIILLAFLAFWAGISFEQNSVIDAFDYFFPGELNCEFKASVLENNIFINLTKDLQQKECNEINWLYEKYFEDYNNENKLRVRAAEDFANGAFSCIGGCAFAFSDPDSNVLYDWATDERVEDCGFKCLEVWENIVCDKYGDVINYACEERD